jgi:peptide/nickel transport system permease protein
MIETIDNIGRVVQHRLALAGGIIILLLVCIAVMAPYLAPHDPERVDLNQSLAGPDAHFPMGTNKLGRCVMSQMIYGTRITLGAGALVVLTTAGIGMMMGIVSGYLGGLIDEMIMRFVDMMLALPGIILALIIAGLLGPGVFNLMLALAVTGWTGFARVVRSTVLSLKELAFIESARALGASNFYIIRVHIIPNCISPVIVLATFGMARAILAISALSFLGLGSQPPNFDWGSMLKESVMYMRTAPHLVVYPGLAIMISVLAFNFFGDGLRDYFDVQANHKPEY